MTEKTFRPMKCEDFTQSRVEELIREHGYVFVSNKIDGIRGVVWEGRLLSNTLKQIKNRHIFEELSKSTYRGLDGELVGGNPFGQDTMQRATSAAMTEGGVPNWYYHVFDNCDQDFQNAPYSRRLESIQTGVRLFQHPRIILAQQSVCTSWAEIMNLEMLALDAGYEGLIIRHPTAPYKWGRSTLREGYMLKVKRFSQSEARILGFYELMHNDNEAIVDPRGLTKRGSSQGNKRPAGTLGGFEVEDIHHGWKFNIGSGPGMDFALRQKVWDNREEYLNKIITYKYLKPGMVDVPRHPGFLAFRHIEDIST
jgi:DNA ligase-1